jgi:hypothetical protein
MDLSMGDAEFQETVRKRLLGVTKGRESSQGPLNIRLMTENAVSAIHRPP